LPSSVASSEAPDFTPVPGTRALVWGTALFLAIAIGGLYYVKWGPYFHRAFVAAQQHTLGVSIITGRSAAAPAPGWQAAWSYSAAYFRAVWQAMVLGLLLGSAVQVLLPRWLERVLGAPGFRSTALAGGVSAASMMCTCCAAPIAVGLGRSRVSPGATLAYWLGNPVLNPAAMVFTGFVLGWHWVALRLLAGIALVFGVAHAAGRLAASSDSFRRPSARPPAAAAERGSLGARWVAALWRLSVGLIPEYVVIVAALGAVRTWLFPAMSPAVGHSPWLVAGLAVAGTLFVIPTAGEIPIVQTLMAFGLGPAGAAALLITLPPVSLPSLIMVGRVVRTGVLVLIAVCVVALGLLGGAAAQVLRF
jgi:uncharacterized membrane protein YraQ (UPF0718 family)